MKTNINPWEGMESARRRRVNEIYNKFECYWVTNFDGKYGYLIQSPDVFITPKKELKLKGITITNKNTDEFSSLLLLLEEKENWEIFLALCNNLSGAATISAVQLRLNRWQKVLQLSSDKAMSREIQMGLFTELSCLKDILEPKNGIKQAINAWVGADFDKQDFAKQNKHNVYNFEKIFLELGVEILHNISDYLSVVPTDATKDMKRRIAAKIKVIKKSKDLASLDKLKFELKRIEDLGGFEKLVPTEGIVFVYKGKTYKLTGLFAPINQLLGIGGLGDK